MLRARLRHAVRMALRWVKDIANAVDPPSGNFSNPDLAYASINRSLARIVASAPDYMRPSYAWGVLQAASLARALGVPRITVIEFGVAGGNGLVALERAALATTSLLGVEVDVHGFDTGMGLPKPTDHRDLPNLYSEAEYRMDKAALLQRLTGAHLHIGLVAATVMEFLLSGPAPIGFIAFDLDYYSSTAEALAVLTASPKLLLPRVHCYFDDIMGFTCSEFTGQRLAIAEFNAKHDSRKISPIFGLRYFLEPQFANQQWAEMSYLAHAFDHPQYCESDGLIISAERPLETEDV